MTRMTAPAEEERAEIEDALAVIARARFLLRAQVALRVRQAVDRDSHIVALLHPALDHIDQIDQALVRAQAIFGAEWRTGQHVGWRRAGK